MNLKIAINDHQPQHLDGFKFAAAVLKRSLLSPGPSYPDTVEGSCTLLSPPQVPLKINKNMFIIMYIQGGIVFMYVL